MIDREGVTDPIDLALIGTDTEVSDAFADLLSRGATDVAAIPLGNPDEVAATWSVMGAVSRA
jgi:hypothetical protein